jgi:Protein of unknown function (DUF2997)
MAEYQKIEYRIGTDGKVSETVLNGKGEACTLATQDMEKSLGKVEARELLPEYHDDGDNFLVNEQSQSNESQG